MAGSIEKFFVTAAPYLIGLASLLIIIAITQIGDTSKKVQETSAYTRVTNCIVGKVANPPTTQDDVELCYVRVEKDTGVDLQRFDTQNYGDN